MKIFIIAGEASGDLHASNLVKALKQKEGSVDIRGWGGDLMEAQGVKIKKHYKELAFMGFVQVAANISTILKNFKLVKEQIKDLDPDAVILVDYPGFNLRIAKWLKEQKFKVIYYISPQLWAWNQKRVKAIEKYVDLMMVILPFEKAFYKQFGVDVEYTGHPLKDHINTYSAKKLDIPLEAGKKVIALLPGSRKQEISKILPIMLGCAQMNPKFNFVIAGAPSIPLSFYKDYISSKDNVHVITDASYDLLSISDAALVTSGTATLETALFKVPQIVLYKGNSLSYQIAKRLIKVKYISLVNLILDKPLLTELIQGECTSTNCSKFLREILSVRNEEIINSYQQLQSLLGEGKASDKAAEMVLKLLFQATF